MLDMPATTIRAWEVRYGAIHPMRTKSGYRIYSDKDISDLKWLKEKIEVVGMSISQAVQMLVHSKSNELTKPIDISFIKDTSFQHLSEELYQALIDFQLDDANRIIELGFSMYRYDDLFHHVLAPLMRKVGEQWVDKRLTIAQEHFVTQFITQRFYQFFRVFPIDASLPKVLAFCPPGEQHQVGLLLFSLFLRQHAMEVIYLGPDTPLDGLNTLILKKDVSIVCVSLTNPIHLPSCLELLNQISSEFPHIKIVLGGLGFYGHQVEKNQHMLGFTKENWDQWYQDNFTLKRTSFYTN
jgi:DNA-binding transcriptional MerR regulator/methylmalonyl-CoA mutase cobalamin-binding subunit